MMLPEFRKNEETGKEEIVLDKEWIEDNFKYAENRYLEHSDSDSIRSMYYSEIMLLAEILGLNPFKEIERVNKKLEEIKEEERRKKEKLA